MLQNYNRYKVLKAFFDSPTKELQLREISRLTNIAPTSVRKYLKEFLQEQLITRARKGTYLAYKAQRESETFKNSKKWTFVLELFEKGLIKYIEDKCNPDAIVLFGSASRGEDIEDSDIDIAILSQEMQLDFRHFEKIFHRKLSALFISDFAQLSKELRNNIVNGIILYGYVKVL